LQGDFALFPALAPSYPTAKGFYGSVSLDVAGSQTDKDQYELRTARGNVSEWLYPDVEALLSEYYGS
jgi:hypothetical protein